MTLDQYPPSAITLFANANFDLRDWDFCNGQLIPIAPNQALFSLLGTTFGGDGRETFGLPNLTPPKDMSYQISTLNPILDAGPREDAFDHGVVGEVMYFAGQIGSLRNWKKCNGQALSTTNYPDLFATIGYTFGGSDETFNLPNLTGPADHINAFICVNGSAQKVWVGSIGDITMLACGGTAPNTNLHLADGATLHIAEYQALYSIIGTDFGGDGETNFKLPTVSDPVTGVSAAICINGMYPARD